MIRNNDDELNYGELMPENIDEQKLLIHLLIDVSGSMIPYMDWINYLLNQMVEKLQDDTLVSQKVELAITTFNDDVYRYQEYRPITKVNTINLTAGGGTELGSAVIDTVNKVKERCHKLGEGMIIRKPMIFLITDGYGGDVTEAAKIVNDRVDDNKLLFWSLGVGDYDRDAIKQFYPNGGGWFETKGKCEINIKEAFREFFNEVLMDTVFLDCEPFGPSYWKEPLSDKNSSLVSGNDVWLPV